MTIAELIERLEDAKGPSRELDFWISTRVFDPSDYSDEALQADIDLVGIEGMAIDAAFTGSIDAALTLAERVLPGHCNSTIKTGTNKFAAYVWQTPKHEDALWSPSWNVEDITSSRAIALCIAILKAKQASEVSA